MSTKIEVHKQSVKQFLESGKEHPFIIPEYQRPYEWGYDQVETLFNDILDFTCQESGTGGKNTYFLGSIVAYINDDTGEQEIIDGQQRITTLFLLLRAIYTSLQNASAKTKEAENFIKQIEPAIWQTNDMTGDADYSKILLESKVMDNAGNDILRDILKFGSADSKATDNYSKNYCRLQELFSDVSKNNPLQIYQFIYTILNKAIVLPITADSQNTALTIFSTLNDRGLPLSDADIFKAKIYNNLDAQGKRKFMDKWKMLDEEATEAGESIQQLFYYYMFYLRALEQDYNSTTPGVRKYYSSNNFERLFKSDLMDNLAIIVNMWKVVNNRQTLAEENWSKNLKVLQALDILTGYPNEFWKYPVVNYYLTYRQTENFADKFARFLHKLIQELLVKYLLVPTINAVKADIIKLNVEILASPMPKFDFKPVDTTQLRDRIKTPHRNAVRMLLRILAYDKQKELLPDRWEIEHILPQKWQNNFFPNVSDEIVKERIEHIGNKLPFEKKLNIIAGAGYFAKKQKVYGTSAIAITKEMAAANVISWDLDSITERDIRLSDNIIKILQQWVDEYKIPSDLQFRNVQLSPEEQAIIENFRKNGRV